MKPKNKQILIHGPRYHVGHENLTTNEKVEPLYPPGVESTPSEPNKNEDILYPADMPREEEKK